MVIHKTPEYFATATNGGKIAFHTHSLPSKNDGGLNSDRPLFSSTCFGKRTSLIGCLLFAVSMLTFASSLYGERIASLSDLVDRGQIGELEKLVSDMPTVLTDPTTAHYLLAVAVRADKIELVRFLLEKKIPVNSKDSTVGYYPLHDAQTKKMVELLLKFGAQTEVKDVEEETPVHNACEFDKFEVLECLVEAGANINPRNDAGRTPLHLAASRGNMKMVQKLLDLGADPEIIDGYGYKPLEYAEKNKHIDIIRILKYRNSWKYIWICLGIFGISIVIFLIRRK